jgi:hypothetical protein
MAVPDNSPQVAVNLTVTVSRGHPPPKVNIRKGKKGTNKQGVPYLIETKIGAALPWTLMDAMTTTKYEHIEQNPGVRAVFSEPLHEAVIYG